MKFRIMILAILFCTISAESWAQGVVREIEIKGEQRIPEETIRAQLGVKPGSMFDRERISKDIHKLFEMGAFQDIQVFEELTSSGLRLIYRIVEKPIRRSKSICISRLMKKNWWNHWMPFERRMRKRIFI